MGLPIQKENKTEVKAISMKSVYLEREKERWDPSQG